MSGCGASLVPGDEWWRTEGESRGRGDHGERHTTVWSIMLSLVAAGLCGDVSLLQVTSPWTQGMKVALSAGHSTANGLITSVEPWPARRQGGVPMPLVLTCPPLFGSITRMPAWPGSAPHQLLQCSPKCAALPGVTTT